MQFRRILGQWHRRVKSYDFWPDGPIDLLAIAKLKPLSLFISLLLMLQKALDNDKIEKWKVKVVSALQ